MNKNSSTKESSSAYMLLKLTYSIIPVAAGADKFLNILTDWTSYAPASALELTGLSASAFMAIVGIIEIAAGIFLWFNTRIGAYVVAAWLLLIALSLVFNGEHFDVAVRDIVMAIGAFALSKLAIENEKKPVLSV